MHGTVALERVDAGQARALERERSGEELQGVPVVETTLPPARRR
jgi:hypothetical protein